MGLSGNINRAVWCRAVVERAMDLDARYEEWRRRIPENVHRGLVEAIWQAKGKSSKSYPRRLHVEVQTACAASLVQSVESYLAARGGIPA